MMVEKVTNSIGIGLGLKISRIKLSMCRTLKGGSSAFKDSSQNSATNKKGNCALITAVSKSLQTLFTTKAIAAITRTAAMNISRWYSHQGLRVHIVDALTK